LLSYFVGVLDEENIEFNRSIEHKKVSFKLFAVKGNRRDSENIKFRQQNPIERLTGIGKVLKEKNGSLNSSAFVAIE
jgi:hypothetical protein